VRVTVAQPLDRYREPVEGAIRFILDQIILPTGKRVGDVIDADLWIRDRVLRPVLDLDVDGLPRHQLAYLELPRGHAKSTYAAALAVAETMLFDSVDVVIAAGDRDQGVIVLDALDGFLERNSALSRSVTRRGDVREIPARHSRIRVISSDAPTAWGLGGTHRHFRVICDELTTWKSDDLWIALVSATGKVGNAQTIVLSNAGFDADNSWQWKVRETARTEDWGYLFSPEGVIASWVPSEWVEQMRTLLPGPSFDRVIQNEWTTSTGDFVSLEQWRTCVDADWERQTRGQSGVGYVAGLDLGLTKDRTAFAIAHRDQRTGHIALDDLLVWQGTRADPVSIATVERTVADAARRFSSLRVYADPWQAKSTIERLGLHGVQIRGFDFTASSVQRLSSTLYSLITSASLRVFEDSALEREILGLRVVQRAGGWRVDHTASGYSDRAMALAMAAMHVAKPSSGRTSRIYDGRDGRLITCDSVSDQPDPWWIQDCMNEHP
jgi:phage terminase large subunit-like protein